MKNSVVLLLILLSIVFSACDNEPLDVMAINTAVLDEELHDLVARVSESEGEEAIECIRFNYPFAIFIFDENMTFLEVVGLLNDEEFIALLESLNENYSISINYPISGTLSNGELIEINTNSELKAAIENCVKTEYKGRCDNTLIDCHWKVTSIDGGDPAFLNSRFNVNYNGIVSLHSMEFAYFGTWVTLFIGNELYLNMDLNDIEQVELFWDGNWLVELLNDQTMRISKDGVVILIEKDCSIPCDGGRYQTCEMELNPGVAEFDLKAYTPCIGVPGIHDMVSAVTYTFYETEDDAINATNAVEGNPYTNIENPQSIYVRTEYSQTGILLNISEIIIEAVPCNDG